MTAVIRIVYLLNLYFLTQLNRFPTQFIKSKEERKRKKESTVKQKYFKNQYKKSIEMKTNTTWPKALILQRQMSNQENIS